MADATQQFSRHKIDLDSLRKLQDLFGKDGELDQEEFVEAFGSILGNGLTSLELTHLFMKIDANSDGSVDWDEFTNYMFLDSQDTNDDSAKTTEESTGGTFFPASYDIYELNNRNNHHHKDRVSALKYVEKHNHILSASQDGLINIWHPTTLLFQGSFHTGQPLKNHGAALGPKMYADNWITDIEYMSASNKLAVSSVHNGISFYEMQTDNHKKVGHIPLEKFGHAGPICLGYHHDSASQSELLLVGTDSGASYVYSWEKHTALLGGSDIQTIDTSHIKKRNKGEDGKEENTRGSKRGAKRIVLRKHTDHVTKIEYIPDLSSLVSCSLDSTVNVYDLERCRVKRTFSQHKKEVYSFAWCPFSKVIASCGLERHIVLWSPYSKNSVATFHGHTSSVMQVEFSKCTNQVISLSNDNTVKVWDIRNQKCIQTISFAETAPGLAGLPPVPVTRLAYVSKHKCLVAASDKLKIFPLRKAKSLDNKSHNQRVVSALYNNNFHQVVSIDEKAKLNLWNVENGNIISHFQLRSDAHNELDKIDQASSKLAMAAAENSTVAASNAGISIARDKNGNLEPVDAVKAAEEIQAASCNMDGPTEMLGINTMSITACCFDDGRRRLITGSHEGSSLNIWNFSNGCLVQKLLPEPEDLFSESSDDDEDFNPRHQKKLPDVENELDLEELPHKKHEVTHIIHVVHVLPRISGHNTIMNKFIVSVGWDRIIRIWPDGLEDAGPEQGYSMRIPASDKDIDKGHTHDIMTISYIPPDVLVTGGFDGRLILWCMSTGKIMRRYEDLGGVGIETSQYLERLNILVAGRIDGTAIILDLCSNNMQVVDLSLQGTAKTYPAILAMTTDEACDVLITGDEKGRLHVWDIVDAREFDYPQFLLLCTSWVAHGEDVTSLDIVEKNELAENFVLSGCRDGTIRMWTMCGVLLGQYGSSHCAWNLKIFYDFPAAIQSAKENHVEASPATCNMWQYWDCPNPPEVALATPVHIGNGAKKTAYKSVPRIGEVWVKVDTDLLKSNEMYKGISDNGVIRIHPKAVLASITVTKQDEIKKDIKGWDGLGGTRTEVSFAITEFLNSSDNGQWQKEDDLSEMIGRIFMAPLTQQLHKVVYIICSQTEQQWFSVDTQGQKHRITYTYDTYYGLKPPRSISLYFRRQQMIAEIGARVEKSTKATKEEKDTQNSAKSKRQETTKPGTLDVLNKRKGVLTTKDNETRPAMNTNNIRELVPEVLSSDGSVLESRHYTPIPPRSKAGHVREASRRQRIPLLKHQKQKVEKQEPKPVQRVHEIADIPLDFGQLRAALSIGGVVDRQSK